MVVRLPTGGGTHGVEYDAYEPGTLWLTTLKDQTVTQMRISDWTVLKTLPLPHVRAHGVVRVSDGLWVVHTADRLIVKLDLASGRVLNQIDVPKPNPEPHGLSIFNDGFLYCDATSGWVSILIFTWTVPIFCSPIYSLGRQTPSWRS